MIQNGLFLAKMEMCQYKRYLCPVILKRTCIVTTQIVKVCCDNSWWCERSDII